MCVCVYVCVRTQGSSLTLQHMAGPSPNCAFLLMNQLSYLRRWMGQSASSRCVCVCVTVRVRECLCSLVGIVDLCVCVHVCVECVVNVCMNLLHAVVII